MESRLRLFRPTRHIFVSRSCRTEDSVVEMRAKIDEYLTMGVEYVWVIAPEELTGEIYTATGIERVRNGIFKAGRAEVDVRGVPR